MVLKITNPDFWLDEFNNYYTFEIVYPNNLSYKIKWFNLGNYIFKSLFINFYFLSCFIII